MEGDGDDVQVSVESSWNVSQGFLDSCVTVVFLDPHTHDPIISTSPRISEKLVLVPPTEPVPCEITVKFQGRLCHVQSFYILSTARICELYSRSKHEADADYICTVKGWIPYEDRCPSDESSEVVLEVADLTNMNGMQEREGIISESVMSSVASSTVMNFAADVDVQKSVYSSSDDSWVDLKTNGSSTAENAGVSLTARELDNGHVPLNEDELTGRLSSKANDTGVKGDFKLDGGCFEGKAQLKDHIVQCYNAQQDMFEAELELVDHNPWAAITVRLLSLQDKSRVEVDQMVFLAVSGPVPEPASPRQCSEKGANSLFAMFLPSMLQMAGAVHSNSNGLLKSENFNQSCEEAQDTIDKPTAEEHPYDTMVRLPAGREEIGKASLQNAVAEEVPVEPDGLDLAAHVYNNDRLSALDAESLSKGISQQSDMDGAELKKSVEIGEPPFQLNSSALPRCNFNKSAGDSMAKHLALTLEKAFSERFDRLESLCLRMESYMRRTLENLDQRISHLEAQHRKDSEGINPIDVSLKQTGTPLDASAMQSQQCNQESPPSSMQHTELSDSPPTSECKEEVSILLTQSAERGCCQAQDALKEAPSPMFFDVVDSDFAAVESLAKEAPTESQELSGGPSTLLVGSKRIQDTKPRVFLDDAWASALSAFTSSFTPVVEVEAENTVKVVVNERPPSDVSIPVPQDCETPHFDVDNAPKTADSEEVNSEEGPIYEDCAHTHFDDQLLTAPALPVSISPENLDSLLHSYSLNMPTSVPKHGVDFLDLNETQSVPGKARTDVGDLLEGRDFASIQGFRSQSLDAEIACPQFDVFAFADSNSMASGELKENTPALRGQAGSPVFDSTSPDMLDVDFFNAETRVCAHDTSTRGNDFSQCQENKDFFLIRAKNQESMPNFLDKASTSNAEGLWFRSFLSSFDTSKAPETEENIEGIFANNTRTSTVDFLGSFMSKEQVKGLDMSEVRDPESLNSSSSYMHCETEEATSFPDVPEEDASNYQDGGACSEDDSLCFSQDFDTCQNDLCDDEWSCAPNIFYLNDPEFSDNEKQTLGADVDEKIDAGDISDTDSTEDLPFWPAIHNAKTHQQQLPTTVVFPGFENLI